MPSDEAMRKQVRELLEGLSDAEVRELCIKALRGAHASRSLMGDQFQMHGHLGRWVLPLLAERKQVGAGEEFSDAPLALFARLAEEAPEKVRVLE